MFDQSILRPLDGKYRSAFVYIGEKYADASRTSWSSFSKYFEESLFFPKIWGKYILLE